MDERVSKEQAGLPTKDIPKFLCEFDTVRQGYHFINPFSSPFVGDPYSRKSFWHALTLFINPFSSSLKVGQLELVEKESTPEKPKQMGNREKMRRKEENWEVINNFHWGHHHHHPDHHRDHHD